MGGGSQRMSRGPTARSAALTRASRAFAAVRLGHAEMVRSMLAQGTVDCIDARNGLGQSILHCAAGGLTALEHQKAERHARTSQIATGTANAVVDSDTTGWSLPTVGIRAPTTANVHGTDHFTPSTEHAQSKRVVGSAAVRAIGRWLKREPQSSSATTKSRVRDPLLPVLASVDWTNLPQTTDNHPMKILTTAPRQRDELEAARLETATSTISSDNFESLPDSATSIAITTEGCFDQCGGPHHGANAIRRRTWSRRYLRGHFTVLLRYHADRRGL
jgi:hypothetical protein